MKPYIAVTVKFDGDVPSSAQSKAMMDFERQLRTMTNLDIRVFKDLMADDSQLRRVVDLRRAKK